MSFKITYTYFPFFGRLYIHPTGLKKILRVKGNCFFRLWICVLLDIYLQKCVHLPGCLLEEVENTCVDLTF